MSKDPAVLFYTSDFLSGTFTMTYEQRGKYITLLCLQHQQGHLSEKQMLSICGEKDPEIWCKFQQDASDLFFNQRMDAEIEKRQAYRQKQKENALKRWNKSGICDGNATAMPLENENENDNGDDIKNKKSTEKKKEIEPPFITLSLVDGTEHGITQAQVDEFETCYPAVDVKQELRSMKAWLITNPKLRKTRNGIMRFVNGWLAREQDKGGIVSRPTKTAQPDYSETDWSKV